jgi:hypothetical protein
MDLIYIAESIILRTEVSDGGIASANI